MVMELQYSHSLATIWSVLYFGVLCQAQEILFNLKDPESNEVISLGQENVALMCHVTDVGNADITIRNADGDNIGNNMGVGNCLEHTLTSLTDADGGEYTCEIRYSDNIDGMDRTLTKSLLLNVESGDRQCFRNGTSMQAFVEGDTLKLSCYCTSTIRCNWIRTIVGDQLGFSIPVYETVEFGNDKRIIRVIIGPVTREDIEDLRYDCYYGQLASERCSIGPSPVSGSDFVLNAVDPSTVLRECPKAAATDPPVSRENSEAETTGPPVSRVITVIPPTDHGGVDGGDGLFLYIIVGAVIVTLPITLMLLLIFIRLRRQQGGETKEQGEDNSVKAPSNSNPAYDDSGYEIPFGGKLTDVKGSLGGEGTSSDGLSYSDLTATDRGDTSYHGLPSNDGQHHSGPNGGGSEYDDVGTTGQVADLSQYAMVLKSRMDVGGDEASS